MSKLYHRDIFLPAKAVDIATGVYVLMLTNHAMSACRNDRYGDIVPPKHLQVNKGNIIELEVNDYGNPIKVVCRLPYDNRNDICIVAAMERNCLSVRCKTLWLNRKDDTHRTLDRSKYLTK